MFDRDLPTPLYKQLKETLKQGILTGEYKENEKIPTESEIEKEFGVSRITVRRAISELVKEDYLVKQPGKGTFVTHPRLEHKFDYAQSFSKNVAISNYHTHSKILSTQILTQDEIAEDFPDSAQYSYKEYYCVSKLRFVNDMPVILEYNFFPLPKMDPVMTFDHSKSLFDNLKENLGISKLCFINGILSVTSSTESMAVKLKIPSNSPVIHIKQTAVDHHSNLLYFGKQIVNSNGYVFKIPKQEVTFTD